MIDSTGVCYLARSATPLPKDELTFHLTQNFADMKDVCRELVARGYKIIGYANGVGIFDLNDRLIPGEGFQEFDLALSGSMASQLMPKERWKFAAAKPIPTIREAQEELAKRTVTMV